MNVDKIFTVVSIDDISVFNSIKSGGGFRTIAEIEKMTGLATTRIRGITKRLEARGLIESFYTMDDGTRHIRFKSFSGFTLVLPEKAPRQPKNVVIERFNDLTRALACAGAGIPL